MPLIHESTFPLFDTLFNALHLVVIEETTVLHPYVEQQADQAIAACEDACIVDGVFDWRNAMPDDTKALRYAALSLLNVLAAEGLTSAQNERSNLALALANGSVK
jgi:hypothetical protein